MNEFLVLPLLFQAAFSEWLPCPFLGPWLPKLQKLSESEIMKKALQQLTADVAEAVETGNSTGGHGPISSETTSSSIALFDAESSEDPSFWQFHHTAPSLRDSKDSVHDVDAKSAYRAGDLTELFTVLLMLIEQGDKHWDEAVTVHLPQFAEAVKKFEPKNNPTEYVDWDEVTLGDLAGHLSGVPRNYGLGDMANDDDPDLTTEGLPPLRRSEIPACGEQKSCTMEEFFEGILHRPPIFLPGTTPAYSEASFQILGNMGVRWRGRLNFRR